MIDDISGKSQSVFQPVNAAHEVQEVFQELLRKSETIQVKPETKTVGDKPQMTLFKLYNFSPVNLRLAYMSGPPIAPSQKVTLMFSVNAMKYFALGTVLDMDAEYANVAVGRLHKLQRRDSFRVTLPPNIIAAKFEIARINVNTVHDSVAVIDLSVGGMGINVDNRTYESLRSADEIQGKLIVGSHSPVLCEMLVRYKRQTRQGPTQFLNQVGCQFKQMPKGLSDKIAFLVNDCHRQIFIRTQKS